MGAKAARTRYFPTWPSVNALWENWFPGWNVSNIQKSRSTQGAQSPISLIPIRSLGANHRKRISSHLTSLSARDRYLRFGYCATDLQIERYVATLDFERDEILGIYDRSLRLIAVAHLAFASADIDDTGAEFGVTVLPHARGRGYGARLFGHAASRARNRNVHQIFIHALSENMPMIRIATNAGARVERHGSESEAFLQLGAATLKGRLSEFVEERVAQADYRIKVRARRTSPPLC